MDETSGATASDATGNGHTGANTNIAFVAPGYDGTGGAYAFNGIARVVVPDAPDLNPGTADITITAHVNTSVLPGAVGDYDLVRKQKAGHVYKLEILGNGTGYCLFKGSAGGKAVKGGPNVVDGRWHTLSCVRAGTTISLVVDGVTVATRVAATGSIAPPIAVYLGRKPDGTDAYTGLMDEVSITIG
jgi:hypothetical protein